MNDPPGGWLYVEDPVPGADVPVEYTRGGQDTLHSRPRVIYNTGGLYSRIQYTYLKLVLIQYVH